MRPAYLSGFIRKHRILPADGTPSAETTGRSPLVLSAARQRDGDEKIFRNVKEHSDGHEQGL
jgi:hypothetical protein